MAAVNIDPRNYCAAGPRGKARHAEWSGRRHDIAGVKVPVASAQGETSAARARSHGKSSYAPDRTKTHLIRIVSQILSDLIRPRVSEVKSVSDGS